MRALLVDKEVSLIGMLIGCVIYFVAMWWFYWSVGVVGPSYLDRTSARALVIILCIALGNYIGVYYGVY